MITFTIPAFVMILLAAAIIGGLIATYIIFFILS
jgi:hypothetical protein